MKDYLFVYYEIRDNKDSDLGGSCDVVWRIWRMFEMFREIIL